MPFLGNTPSQGFTNSVTKDDFTPNGSTTAFTLSKASNTNNIEVYVGNVRQEPTSSYSVSGTTLTMTEAPATGTNFYVMHESGSSAISLTPAAGTSVPGAFGVSGALTAGSAGVTGALTAGALTAASAGVTGNTTVGGTLVNTGLITASAGVAIGGTGSANTLDDYEEGTWTPGGTGINSGTSVGYYTKVGNVCHTQMWIHANGSTDGTITGLPFTAGTGSSNAIAAGTVAYQNGSVTGILSGGASTTFTMYNGTATGSLASGNQMHCAMTYRTT